MKTRIENLNNDLTYRLENGVNIAAFWAMAALITVLVVLYFYFLTSSVFNIAWRTNTDSRISALRSNVSELEAKYLNTIGNLSIDKAKSLGLKEFNKPIFAISGDGEKLTFNSQGNF
ncbi:MAG: hypothetical protein AAB888_00155 [Patescibacteria group bacterium]